MNRKVSVIEDLDGKKIVFIHDIKFKGKRAVNWNEVKEYLKNYVGEFYNIVANNEMIYIGNDLPSEYTGSKYTYKLKGTVAKAKANVAQGIPELLETAQGGSYRENHKEKHNRNAKYGWYRYDIRFGLPVYDDKTGNLDRYNIFTAILLIKHSEDGNKYLHDITTIKKETSSPLES